MDQTAPARTSWRPFAVHFLEMVVAMVVGMAMLGMVVRLVLTQLGYPYVLDRTEVGVAVMATNMTVGMTVLMVYRGHRWPGIAEMATVMYLPFLILLVPFWLGVISAGAVMAAGHLLMLPFMFLVMLRRRDDYSHRSRSGRHPAGTDLALAPSQVQDR